MHPKEFYKTYRADDKLSTLSSRLLYEISLFHPVHALEFGMGTGKHLNVLNIDGVATIGIDISPYNVAKAIHKYDLPCAICGDETYLRNLCNLDVVFTCSVLDHIEDITGIIDEFKRIANRAVIIAETVDTPSDYYYSHDFESYGFKALSFQWKGQDGAVYRIWKWEKEFDNVAGAAAAISNVFK